MNSASQQRQTAPIRLPQPNYIEKIRSKTSKTPSNENLAEMAAFDPSHMSSSPPGGTFMYNLRQRMEKA
jgi:hypothetical protein